MSIIRAPRPEGGFYALDRRIAEDSRLSWAARGVLVFLLVKPDHWKVSIEHLRKQTEGARIATGRDAIYAILAELEACGYVIRRQARCADGRMAPTEYLVSESPHTGEPLPAEPFTADTTLDKNHSKTIDKGISGKARAPDFAPPEWVPADAWAAWLEVRRKKRAANTAHALTLAVRELDKLCAEGHDPRAVLEQSTLRSWTGLFSLKNNTNGQQQHDHANPFTRRRGESLVEYSQRVNRLHDERERAAHGVPAGA